MDTQIQIPEWARLPETDYPLWTGSPRHYRFNGETGAFSVGTTVLGAELWVQPFSQRWAELEERWRFDAQAWMDVAFVDQDHVVSTLSLKKDSAVNFEDFTQRCLSGRQFGVPVKPSACWLKLEALELSSREGQPYYVVQVSDANIASEEQFKKLWEFDASGVFEWVLVGEVSRA